MLVWSLVIEQGIRELQCELLLACAAISCRSQVAEAERTKDYLVLLIHDVNGHFAPWDTDDQAEGQEERGRGHGL